LATGRTHVPPDGQKAAEADLHAGGDAASHPKISDREFEVLRGLVAGQRPSEIARELRISIKTVSTHKARLFQKLGLDSMAALVRYAIAQGFDVDTTLAANGVVRPGASDPESPTA
jgi:DNA-binding NarL/FixJ family response regulator